LSNNTTADIIDLRMGFSVDYSTDVKFRAITDTGEIETEVSTGGGHASVTIDVPFTTAGYVLDGNSMSIEILGETSGCGVTGDVNIYGYDLNYVLKARPNEEID